MEHTIVPQNRKLLEFQKITTTENQGSTYTLKTDKKFVPQVIDTSTEACHISYEGIMPKQFFCGKEWEKEDGY